MLIDEKRKAINSTVYSFITGALIAGGFDDEKEEVREEWRRQLAANIICYLHAEGVVINYMDKNYPLVKDALEEK